MTYVRPDRGLVDSARQVDKILTDATFDYNESTGWWCDNFTSPSVGAIVHKGQLIYLGISDGALRLPADQLEDRVNSCIFLAFAMHRSGGRL